MAERAPSLSYVPAALLRGAGFLVAWVVLVGSAVSAIDVAVGLVAAASATWSSLRLAPPRGRRFRPVAALRLATRFLRQSLVAGWDVARRALDPRLPIRPGTLNFPSRLPAGPDREGFRALTSLMPGTLPFASDEEGTITYHCLDVDQPNAVQLEVDLRLRSDAFGGPA